MSRSRRGVRYRSVAAELSVAVLLLSIIQAVILTKSASADAPPVEPVGWSSTVSIGSAAVSTVAGSGASGSVDGTGSAASFGSLVGMPIAGGDLKFARRVGLPAGSPAVVNRGMTVNDYIGQFRNAKIRGQIPGEFLNQTVEDALRSGDSTVRKLLTDNRWSK